jgi:hypothetical protein
MSKLYGSTVLTLAIVLGSGKQAAGRGDGKFLHCDAHECCRLRACQHPALHRAFKAKYSATNTIREATDQTDRNEAINDFKHGLLPDLDVPWLDVVIRLDCPTSTSLRASLWSHDPAGKRQSRHNG